MDYCSSIQQYLSKLTETISALDVNQINNAMIALEKKYQQEANIYVFGNGGSAATASHFVCDFNKGASEGKEKKFNFICLNDNTPIMMAIANDISYDDVFAFQLQGKLKKDDMIVAISGSGNSKNVIKAVEYAKGIGCEVVGLTGYSGGKLMQLSDYPLHVNINDMQIAEDIHMVFNHMIMQIMSNSL